MHFRYFGVFLFLALLWPTPSRAANSIVPLDQKAVHEAYNEGNFDYVIGNLENFIRANKTYSHDDSIFVAKHLAVVYSANPATREKGRYFMNRLLELVPSAKLVDMYVSEEIDRIFEKVREEFVTRQRSFGIDHQVADLPARPNDKAQPAAAQPAQGGGRKKGKGMLWFAGGVGVAAVVGGVAYYTLHDDASQGADKTYVVPK